MLMETETVLIKISVGHACIYISNSCVYVNDILSGKALFKLTVKLFFSFTFENFNTFGDTTIDTPFGIKASAIYFAVGSPTFVTVRLTVILFEPSEGMIMDG